MTMRALSMLAAIALLFALMALPVTSTALAATPRGIFTTGVSERPQQESESLLDQQEMQNEGTVENIFGKAAKWLAERGNNAMLLSMDKSLKMVSNPVNIFESSFEHVILKAHNTMLALMFGAIVLVIMYYAYRVIANSMELPPSTFLVRIIIVSVVAAFAPRLIQDLLNINNHLVELFTSDALFGIDADDTMRTIHAKLQDVPPELQSGGMFIIGILMSVLVLVFSGILWVWSYIRIMEIYVLTIVAPVAFLLLMLPSRAPAFSAWLQRLIRMVFTQALWALVLAFSLAVIRAAFVNESDLLRTMVAVAAAYWIAIQAPQLLDMFMEGQATGMTRYVGSSLHKVASKTAFKAINWIRTR